MNGIQVQCRKDEIYVDSNFIHLELTMVLKNSDDPEEMAYYWKEWYDKAGKPNRRHFEKYLKLRNEAAVLNGWTKII